MIFILPFHFLSYLNYFIDINNISDTNLIFQKIKNNFTYLPSIL